MQIARHINDEQSLQSCFTARRLQGIEIDIRRADDWMVGDGRNGGTASLAAFLGQVEALQGARGGDRLKTMIEVKGTALTHEDADALLDHCERYRDDLEVRFVGYAPEVMNTLYHAAASRDEPLPCQIYMQEDDVMGHVQWTKRRRLGLADEVGYHLRLHAFSPSKRPTYDEAVQTGRRITTTGWNPLYRGWRNLDLSQVWNIKRT